MPSYYPVAESGATISKVDPKLDRVIRTGETRAPKRGEWYLSGAIPEGYQAPNDLTQEFQICKLVRGRMVWIPVAK